MAVGHSFGSSIVISIALNHPNDASALVLTGYSLTIDFRVVQNLKLEPAVVHSPSRFLSVPLGYVVMANQTQREHAFYNGAYNPAVARHDFAYEDIVADAEFGGQATLFHPAVGYTGHVLAATGAEDNIFCPNGGVPTCETILGELGTAYKSGCKQLRDLRGARYGT
ncbi:hypothetical protein B0H67DRAFT_548247 [Lasiosphaeris hirsuta]|uniref:Uncharacterized protein n=1 Tax=Lasiosphaeris hirsuta TaxID=260670 RepID=A0AA40B9R7_9PEZI|nr:hypothetical protein B0H67DRAFT_548247 [Lasiosphaeris hirsuta]